MKKEEIKIALIGNTNVGKTTLLNTISGEKKETSNYPGTTVEIFEAKIKYKNKNFLITDLPGIYNFSPYSEEEKVTKEEIEKNDFDFIVHVFDSSSKRRTLALMIELMEFDLPLVLVLNNKHDRENWSKFKEEIKEKLELKVNVLDASKSKTKFDFMDLFSQKKQKIKKIYKTVHKNIIDKLNTDEKNIHKNLEKISKNNTKLKQKIKENRFNFIDDNFKSIRMSRAKKSWSDFIDKILLNKFLGVFIFFFLMWISFEITFRLGDFGAGFIENYLGFFKNYISSFFEKNSIT